MQCMGKDEIRQILKRYYGLNDVMNIKRLPGFDDQNWYVECPVKYVLKVTERDSLESLKIQDDAMKKLSRSGFNVPKIRASVQGSEIVVHGDVRIRLLSFIEGSILREKDFDASLLRNVGRYLARMDITLEGFTEPKETDFIWNLKRIQLIEPYISGLGEEMRRCVEDVVESTKSIDFSGIRAGWVHNDFKATNIITDGKDVLGVIDFADVVYSAGICDLAICMAHFIEFIDIRSAIEIFRGYDKIRPLRKEKEHLYTLIAARLAALVTMSTHYRKEYPDNEYVHGHLEPACEGLNKILSISREKFSSMLG